MGAAQFSSFALGKNAKVAFARARREAAYWHGHGGYTGTIAEKPGFVFAGQVNSRHLDRLEQYFYMAGSRQMSKIPNSIKPTIKKHMETYDDKWGPAVCFEVTGKRKAEIKEAMGRKGTHDKVYVFLGWASS